MALSSYIREQAFGLYCAEIPIIRIAKELGIKSDSTVHKWIKKYNWEEKRNNISKLGKEYSNLDDTQRHIKLVETVMNMYLKAIKDIPDKMLEKTSARDVMEAIKMHRLIKGETTENVNINAEELKTIKESFSKWLKEE